MKTNYSWNEFMELLPNLLPVLIPIMIIMFTLLITALISLIKKRVPWGQKMIWLIMILFVNLIGPIIYFAIGSKMLDDKTTDRNEEEG